MKYFLSKIHYSNLLLLGGLLLLGAVGCQAVVTQQSETPLVETESVPVADTAESEEAEISSGEGQGQIVESDEPNQCLICHTDQQALMDTADSVVAVESESSGEG